MQLQTHHQELYSPQLPNEMVIFNLKLQRLRPGGDDEGLGEFGEFLGLLGEGGGAVDNVGGSCGVPVCGGVEVTVVNTDKCASSEVSGVDTDTRHPTPDTRINRINHR
jgi:hypothetical protein